MSPITLSPGTRIGPYEVTDQIGAGGMGEVYRATNINLKRQVASKVLPAAVAADAERRRRIATERRYRDPFFPSGTPPTESIAREVVGRQAHRR